MCWTLSLWWIKQRGDIVNDCHYRVTVEAMIKEQRQTPCKRFFLHRFFQSAVFFSREVLFYLFILHLVAANAQWHITEALYMKRCIYVMEVLTFWKSYKAIYCNSKWNANAVRPATVYWSLSNDVIRSRFYTGHQVVTSTITVYCTEVYKNIL